jgi:hypothetical protein
MSGSIRHKTLAGERVKHPIPSGFSARTLRAGSGQPKCFDTPPKKFRIPWFAGAGSEMPVVWYIGNAMAEGLLALVCLVALWSVTGASATMAILSFLGTFGCAVAFAGIRVAAQYRRRQSLNVRPSLGAWFHVKNVVYAFVFEFTLSAPVALVVPAFVGKHGTEKALLGEWFAGISEAVIFVFVLTVAGLRARTRIEETREYWTIGSSDIEKA